MNVTARPTATQADSQQLAREARVVALDMLHHSGGGHFGGVMSVIDSLAALYSVAPIGRGLREGDRLVFSKGHAAAGLYAVLARLGWIIGEGKGYGSLDAGLEGHPDMTTCDAVHFSTGSLGQGLAAGVGMAIGLQKTGRHVWVILGDGECQEGQVWEAAILASRYRLTTLHVVVDLNGRQECGWSHDPRLDNTPLPNAEQKWRAFGWNVATIDGHDHGALTAWIRGARGAQSAPTVALALTRKGYGVRLFQEQPERAHFTQLTAGEYAQAREELYSC